jgi:hypothetical protein
MLHMQQQLLIILDRQTAAFEHQVRLLEQLRVLYERFAAFIELWEPTHENLYLDNTSDIF